jgi:hypothetical protein
MTSNEQERREILILVSCYSFPLLLSGRPSHPFRFRRPLFLPVSRKGEEGEGVFLLSGGSEHQGRESCKVIPNLWPPAVLQLRKGARMV